MILTPFVWIARLLLLPGTGLFGVIDDIGGAGTTVVTVAGIAFDTAMAEITLNGAPSDATELARGLVVRIEAQIDAIATTRSNFV